MVYSPWLDVDWSAHTRWVEVAGRPVNVVEMGAGPPVVLIHGHSGAWQNWLEQIPVLAARFRVIAFDLPGFGRSPLPRDPITISGYGRIVDELLGALDVGEGCAVVGNSMGGFVGAELAICFPERVERLALVSAAGISTTNVYRTPALTAGRIGAAMMANQAVDNRRIAQRPRARQLALALVARHPRLLAPDLAYEGLLRGAYKPGFLGGLRASIEYDYRERLPEIEAPTLIVWG